MYLFVYKLPPPHRRAQTQRRSAAGGHDAAPPPTACLGCSEGRREKEATCLNMFFFFFSYERGCRGGSNEPPMIGNKCCGLGMFSGECKSPGNQWSGPAEANVCCRLVSHGFHVFEFSGDFSHIVSFAETFIRSLALLVISLPASQISSFCRETSVRNTCCVSH